MPESRTSLQESILGAWTLSSSVIADVSGENREYSLGEDARGVLIYTADGFMSVQISKQGRPAYAHGTLHGGTDAERAAAAAGNLAYAGRYSFQGDVVTHKPLVSLFPTWAGFDVPRRARITSETLTLALRCGYPPVAPATEPCSPAGLVGAKCCSSRQRG